MDTGVTFGVTGEEGLAGVVLKWLLFLVDCIMKLLALSWATVDS